MHREVVSITILQSIVQISANMGGLFVPGTSSL
jgi:hypothetical protein